METEPSERILVKLFKAKHLQDEKIAAVLMDPNWDVRRAAVEFFDRLAHVSPKVEEKIAVVLTDPDWSVRKTATALFSIRQVLSAEIFKIMGEILKSGEDRTIGSRLDFLSKISISRIIDCIRKMDKQKISSEILICLIVKLLLSKTSLYRCSAGCIQVGEEVIRFESEEELVEFTRNFQRVFRELTNLNLDQTGVKKYGIGIQ